MKMLWNIRTFVGRRRELFHTSLNFLKDYSARAALCSKAASKVLRQDIMLPKYLACGVVLTGSGRYSSVTMPRLQ